MKINNQLKIFLIIFFIVLSVLIIKYWGFGLDNQNTEVILVQHFMNKSLFKNDWYVNSNSQFDIRLGYTLLVAVFESVIKNYEITYLLLLFLGMIIFSLGYYKIMFLLTKNKILSLWGILFPLIIYNIGLGNSFDTGHSFVPTVAAWCFAIWAIYLYFKEKYLWSFFLLGAASLFQIMIGVLLFGILIFQLIFNKIENKKSAILKSLSFFIVFFVGAFTLLKNSLNSKTFSAESIIYILAKFRNPWHYSPFSWSPFIWMGFLVFFVFFLIAFKYSKIDNKYKRIFKYFIVCIFIYYILGTVFVEIFPLKLFSKLQLFRISELLNIIEFIFISEFIYNRLTHFNNSIRNKLGKKKFFIEIAILLGLITLISLVYLLAPKVIVSYALHPTFLLLVMGLAFTWIVFSERETRYILILLIAMWLLAYLIYNPLIGRYKYDTETQKLYSYIEKNTRIDDILLTPPQIATFRLGTKRAIVIDFKGFPFGEAEMVGWYDRILDVTNSQDKAYQKGVSFESIKDGYKTLSKEDILRLKEEYGFDYAVFEKPKELNFPIFYENNRFVVYKV